MTTYLLDTDIAIELLRWRNVHVAEQLASKNRNYDLCAPPNFGAAIMDPGDDPGTSDDHRG